MWGFALDVETSSPIYIKECISRSGHITLLLVYQNPFRIKLYPSTFIDEIKKDNKGEGKIYYIDKKEVLDIKEADVLTYGGQINIEDIKMNLSPVLTDPYVDEVILLTTKIQNCLPPVCLTIKN